MATRKEAIAHVQRYAALSAADAGALVDAVARAAADEAIDAIAEPNPAPTALADVRAARLARICSCLKPPRLLRPVEVATIFRLQASTARGAINRVRASYPQLTEEWTRELVRSQANEPEDISTDPNPNRWEVVFNDPIVVDYAYELLEREGMTLDVTRRRPEQALQFPRQVRDRQGELRDVLGVLGL